MEGEREVEREQRFAWEETHERVRELLSAGDPRGTANGRSFAGADVELRVPLLFPPPVEGEAAASWLPRSTSVR